MSFVVNLNIVQSLCWLKDGTDIIGEQILFPFQQVRGINKKYWEYCTKYLVVNRRNRYYLRADISKWERPSGGAGWPSCNRVGCKRPNCARFREESRGWFYFKLTYADKAGPFPKVPCKMRTKAIMLGNFSFKICTIHNLQTLSVDEKKSQASHG